MPGLVASACIDAMLICAFMNSHFDIYMLAEMPRLLHEIPVHSSLECEACIDELDASAANGQVSFKLLCIRESSWFVQ